MSWRLGPDPHRYEARGTVFADTVRAVAAEDFADPLDVADAEVAARRQRLSAVRRDTDMSWTPEDRATRRAARDALYEAIEARDQLRGERHR